MKKYGCILFQTHDGWQLAEATAAPTEWDIVEGLDVAPGSLASNVAKFVETHDLRARVALALASTTALAASFSVDKRQDLRDRRQLSYQLEEHLPVATEEIVADYIIDGPHVLGVVAKLSELLPIVEALEELGLRVESIAPAALLALQSFLDRTEKISAELVAWQNGSTVELFRIGSRIQSWRHLSLPAATLHQQVGGNLLRQNGRLRMLLIDMDPALHDSLTELDTVDVDTAASDSFSEHVRRTATAALSGAGKPWIELRRGLLTSGDPHRAVRGAWRLCLGAVALLLASMIVFFWMRSLQFQQSVESVQQAQASTYRSAFPGTRVPSAIVARFKSEHSKLKGARGKEAAVRLPPSALNVLHTIVNGLPSDVRWQVQQIRIENGQIDVDVNVRGVGDAGELAAALQNHGLAVDPPTTEQLDAKSVSVRLHGMLEDNRVRGADLESQGENGESESAP